MANRRMEFMIGMTAVVIFVTVIVMAVLFGSNRTSLFQFKQGQRLSIKFDSAPGIRNTSRVTKSGVEIGRVVQTKLVEEEKEGSYVLVYFTINDPSVHIYSNENARIKPSLLMGEAEIEFVKNTKNKDPVHVMGPNDRITGEMGGDLVGKVASIEEQMKSAIVSIESTAQEATSLIKKINSYIGDNELDVEMGKERFNSILNSLSQTLETTRALTANVNEILSDQQIRDNIRNGAAEFPQILEKVDSILSSGDELFRKMENVVARTEGSYGKFEEIVDNVNEFSKSLPGPGKSFIETLNASSQDIAEVARNINRLSSEVVEQLDNKETPIGMLTDEEVGREIRGIVRNVEAASEKVQPILDDARVFTNKIAHRPSALVFSRDTYKGAPALAAGGYSYQPYSPAGGMSSRLWTETRRRAPCPASGGSAYYPDSLESFRASHPETYSELERQKPVGSCLSANPLFGKGLFSRDRDAEPSAQAGYVSDPGVYYGLEGVVPVEGYYAEGSYPGTMPVSNENEMDVPKGGACGMKFSLTRAFHRVFGGNDEAPASACPLKPQASPGVPMIGALYGANEWTSADGIPAETISWAPSYSGDDVLLYDGGCAVPSDDVPTCDAPSCDIPSCDAPMCDAAGLGGAQTPSGNTQDVSAPLPNRSDYGPMESPLPPRPSESPAAETPADETKPAAEELPSSTLRPESPKKNAYEASSIAPGYSNSAAPIGLPAPAKSRSRNFVDDGLPLRFSPND
ncbi:MAG: MCE family protein [Thermoguttaceae bacterium]|nr:MCE family protein [Thermoguttaceae bacterium]